ncbi:haloacid dehalogenase superfamily, subfamily IA, variant 3 with third motif having DD or ED [Poseidonocella pacifica]|uniref:Haloacid dehalogenase superfamily, subfamily IA, variant 3 with third motif having DD or ED n=1 Tax=Poseidonocella pacifica TaxID=871651 RepID=A0A1I0VM69_9RHOB|nr:HAD family phosphatase [Poseidonocella pacifica]SFA77589.1 haloacid dehalogenase superfamily, subfamily IA, variant 3 with third motif having DD or ED [Poseidonocella pacifica]
MVRSKAVIFDLDGCLVDSEPLSLESIASEMRTLGIADATAEEIGSRFLGVAMPVISDYVAGRLGAPVPNDFVSRVEDSLLATYQSDLRQIPGAEDLLNGLEQNGFGMGVATGGSLRRMKTTLDLAGLSGWFNGTACSAEEVAKGKPEPDLFLLALDRLQVSAANSFVLEDSPHGVKGALAAGIPAVGFVGGSHLEGRRETHAAILREAGASAVFATLAEVENFIVAQSEHGT